jgi:hypothetical protein
MSKPIRAIRMPQGAPSRRALLLAATASVCQACSHSPGGASASDSPSASPASNPGGPAADGAGAGEISGGAVVGSNSETAAVPTLGVSETGDGPGVAPNGPPGSERMGASVLAPDAILAAQAVQEPKWYVDNIPFVDTPDATINEIYYYRWSTYKRALRYTTPDTGYVSTEYDNQIWYSGNEFSYGALSDAAGYHILDGRWLRNRVYVDDYLQFWLNGSGRPSVRSFSEWIIAAAYQRSLVTGDTTLLESNLAQLIALYGKWSSNFTQNIFVNGAQTNDSLYFQSPLSDATEFTETSMHTSDFFGGGAGYRPTINSYLYAGALAISQIAALAGDTANASSFATRAAQLQAGVQAALWDPQRQFFMQVYNDNASNVGIARTRTTWREAMGFAPWAFELPDATFSAAWQQLDDPRRFAGPYGLTTLERWHDLEAEQATMVGANLQTSASASNGGYVGQLDNADSSVQFTVNSPGAGTFPVQVFFANGSGALATHTLVVNGAAASPITVSYPPTGSSGAFSNSQLVTVRVPMTAGPNTLRFSRGTGAGVELDRIAANPYFGYQSFPAAQNHDDASCCHWNAPSWPYATSMTLTGLANLLQDYPAQSYVTKQTYYGLLRQFADQQHRDGVPHVAEAANADTGEWVYDAVNFSEHYNHSSFVDLVLTGLLGIKPQADDRLVLKPLVPDAWSYFAVQNLPYHGHLLSIVWDLDGTHYNAGSGLQVFQDGTRIFESATLGNATLMVAPPVQPAAAPRLQNVAANAWLADQDWLKGWDNRNYTATFPTAFASYTKATPNGRRCRSSDNPRCTDAYDSPLKAIDGFIRYDAVPDDRWTNVGSANASDFIGVDFGAPRDVSEVMIYTYDDGQDVRAPQELEVQYLSGNTWAPVPGQIKVPAMPAANESNEITFPAVRTAQLRVVLTPQPGKYVGVTELESWYPQP